MTVTRIHTAVKTSKLVMLDVCGGDLIGDRYKTLSVDDYGFLEKVFAYKGMCFPFSDVKDVKQRYDPKIMSLYVASVTKPDRTWVIWFSSRADYFTLRCRYLGYPHCCIQSHKIALKEGLQSSKDTVAPIGIVRCPLHKDLSAQEYLNVVNSSRYHFKPQEINKGIAKPSEFFLNLVYHVLYDKL